MHASDAVSSAEQSTQEQSEQQQAVSAKNKKKKEQRKRQKNRQEVLQRIFERNASEIKYPLQLEQEGAILTLEDVKLQNHNPIGRYKQKLLRDKQRKRSASSSSSSSGEDDNDVEELDDYHLNGYHAAHVGEIIDSKYVLLKKLGWGHFSTVWLAFKLSDKQLYALKIQKSAAKYTESGFEEEDILFQVASNFKDQKWEQFLRKYYKNDKLEASRDHTHNLQMFDQFFHHSLNGKHFVMAFEVLGKNLLSLIKKYDYRGVPMPVVRSIARQMLLGLDYMHRVCGIIHTDLKPENVVFALPEKDRLSMLLEHVIGTPLIELLESKTPIILNKKQLANQKKKERKKKKKQEAKQGDNEEDKG